MKRAFLAFAALSLAPLAHGQATCADYEKVIAEASTRFDAFRGEKIEPGIFHANTALPGFPSCGVVQKDEAGFTCYRVAISESQGLAHYEREIDLIRSCVPDWEQKALDPPKNRLPNDPEIVVGERFIKKTEAGYVSIGAVLAIPNAGPRSMRVFGVAVKLNPLSSPLS